MTRIKVRIKSDEDHERWLEERREGIGGSDVAAVAGISPYKTPLQVYLEKVEGIKEDVPGEAAYWGTVLEDLVAREFSKRSGLKTERVNAILQHDQFSWMLANLDRRIIDKGNGPGVLECKTASTFKTNEWAEDKIPDYYLLQVQHYLAVTGWEYGYIAVLIGGNHFMYKKIERDEDIINYLIQIESDFWKRVEENNPPEWTGRGNEGDILDAMYPVQDLTDEEIIARLKRCAYQKMADYFEIEGYGEKGGQIK